MIKIDLITGPLGSGKTTFIKKYLEYLVKQNEKIGVIENDYGAINVDRMLLNDFSGGHVDVQMIVGGCGRDCHVRRFKSKLITMSLLGYKRVIVEPSGIYDMDEFFDVLSDDDIVSRYEIGSIIAITKTGLDDNLSPEEKYVMASEVSSAGKIVLSFYNGQNINDTLNKLNDSLKEIKARRILETDDLFFKPFEEINDEDFKILEHSGYRQVSYEKKYHLEDLDFKPMFFLNPEGSLDDILNTVERLWHDEGIGKILRIKGFVNENNKWYEINSINDKTDVREINKGQSLIIIIGENIDVNKIDEYLKSDYSSLRTK